LLKDTNDEIFYVGKGTKNRMYKHEQIVKQGKIPHNNYYLYEKIKSIIINNEKIIYEKIYENVSSEK